MTRAQQIGREPQKRVSHEAFVNQSWRYRAAASTPPLCFFNMIGKDEARSLVLASVLKSWDIEGDEPIILDDVTIERPFGWVFFYQSSKQERTGNSSYPLVGNAPIIVNRFDGSLHVRGTARPTEEYVREYEARLEKS